MVPRTNRDSQKSPSALLPFEVPSDSEMEELLGAESNDSDREIALLAVDEIMFCYHRGTLSAEYRQRVEERLRTDPTFSALVEEARERWERSKAQEELDDPAELEELWKLIRAHEELKKQGIRVPSESGRRRYPRRSTVSTTPPPALDPTEFVERLATELGTHSAKVLVMNAFRAVEYTGEPECWISEVARARECGIVSPAVATFLIWQFAEAAIMHIGLRDPELSELTGAIEQLELEHGLDENTAPLLTWTPPDWKELHDYWSDEY